MRCRLVVHCGMSLVEVRSMVWDDFVDLVLYDKREGFGDIQFAVATARIFAIIHKFGTNKDIDMRDLIPIIQKPKKRVSGISVDKRFLKQMQDLQKDLGGNK